MNKTELLDLQLKRLGGHNISYSDTLGNSDKLGARQIILNSLDSMGGRKMCESLRCIITKQMICMLILTALVLTTPLLMCDKVYATGDCNATVSTGYVDQFVIRDDNSLWTWSYDSVEAVKIMDDVKYVSAGAGHVMAIKTDNSLWAWGSNAHGAIGDGKITTYDIYYNIISNNDILTPIEIMQDVKSVSAGYDCTVAVKTDGSLWAWGDPSWDKLESESHVPVKIMTGVKSASIDIINMAIIKNDDSLWIAGGDSYGQHGQGISNSGTKLSKALDNVKSVSIGEHYIMAIRTDDTLWSWGWNAYGQLGIGSDTAGRPAGETKGNNRYVPTKVASEVSMVVADRGNARMIKKDGSLWVWGWNVNGRLGDGTLIAYRDTPTKIMDGAKFVSLKYDVTLVLKQDSSIWIWGDTINDSYYSEPIALNPYNIALPSQNNVKLILRNTTVAPTTALVFLNGKQIGFEAYNINANNYFKLRDVAYVLSDTNKKFEVDWDNAKKAISLTSGKVYTHIGSEMVGRGLSEQLAVPSSSKIYVDGKEVDLTVYNINGANYFKLRDIAKILDFNVYWDSNRSSIIMNTEQSYVQD